MFSSQQPVFSTLLFILPINWIVVSIPCGAIETRWHLHYEVQVGSVYWINLEWTPLVAGKVLIHLFFFISVTTHSLELTVSAPPLRTIITSDWPDTDPVWFAGCLAGTYSSEAGDTCIGALLWRGYLCVDVNSLFTLTVTFRHNCNLRLAFGPGQSATFASAATILRMQHFWILVKIAPGAGKIQV